MPNIVPRSGSLPVVPKRSAALDRIRQAKPPAIQQTASDLRRAALDASRPRLLAAVDASISREAAWSAAKATTNALFSAVPEGLDVGLAVHGGSEMQTWMEPVPDAARLRDRAASMTCVAGGSWLMEVLDRSRSIKRLKVLVYVGDMFEGDLGQALQAAKALRLKGCRIVILHDARLFGAAESACGDTLARSQDSDFSAIADAGGGPDVGQGQGNRLKAHQADCRSKVSR